MARWSTTAEIFAEMTRPQNQRRRHSRDELIELIESAADELLEDDRAEQRAWVCPACLHVRRVRETTA